MTTIPFWLTFDSLDKPQNPDGPMQMKDLQIARASGPVSRLSSLLHSGNKIKVAPRPKYCPQCLIDDVANYGEPFWHRAHQLPNVTVCVFHSCKLADRCNHCGSIVAPLQHNVAVTARLRCNCGNPLTTHGKDSYRVPKQETALAKISLDALMVRNRDWHYRHVRQYLYHFLGSKSWQAVVKNAFSTNNRVVARTSTRWSQITAQDCATLLAAMDIEFSDAAAGFSNVAMSDIESVERKRVTRIPIESLTVERAREELLLLRSVNSKITPSMDCPQLYWCLRLYDPQWLLRHFPNMRPGQIPTIANDRKYVLKVIESGAPTTKMLLARAFRCGAGIRAKLRDSAWVREQLSKIKEDRDVVKFDNTNSIKQRQKTIVLRAITRIVERKDRPVRISAPGLAKATGLTASQVRSLLSGYPYVAKEVAAANADVLRRLLLWAIRDLEAKQEPYVKSDIYVHASRRSIPEVRDVLEQILKTENSESMSFFNWR